MRTRLTERDLSRIVRRVINEQDEMDNEYCDIDDSQGERNYDILEPFIEKLIKADRINYECEFHKSFLMQMLVGDLCTQWEQLLHTRLPKGIDPRKVYDFLKSKYSI